MGSATGLKTTALLAHHSRKLKVDRVIRQKPISGADSARAVFDALPKARLRAALIGNGIQQSRTPWMHAEEGARLGLDYSYELIDFEASGLPDTMLEEVLALATEGGFAGLNVTHPFKQQVVRFLDELSPEAAAIGAVNTVVFTEERKAVGHNTDCWGFAESFRSRMAGAKLDRVLLLGAGGAGKAVAHALADMGAGWIDVFDIDRALSADLVVSVRAGSARLRGAVETNVAEAASAADGMVNTTPVGMAGYPGTPVPLDVLRPDLWVADVVYFPAETELLRAASAAGSRVLPGKGMAVFQAVKAFELITGFRAEPEQMFRHFASASAVAAVD